MSRQTLAELAAQCEAFIATYRKHQRLGQSNDELRGKAGAYARIAEELAPHIAHEREQAAEQERLREALQGIIDIGKRDMTNSKYDGYFDAARAALAAPPPANEAPAQAALDKLLAERRASVIEECAVLACLACRGGVELTPEGHKFIVCGADPERFVYRPCDKTAIEIRALAQPREG